jgi:hypothetical protein
MLVVWPAYDVPYPVFLRCTQRVLARPEEDGRIRKRPTSVGELVGKSKWEKPLADWITGTGVGLVGQEMRVKEAERVERNDGRNDMWRREPFL